MAVDHLWTILILSLSPLLGYGLARNSPEELRSLNFSSRVFYWSAFISCTLVAVYYTQTPLTLAIALLSFILAYWLRTTNIFWLTALSYSVSSVDVFSAACVIVCGMASGVLFYHKKKSVGELYGASIALFIGVGGLLPFVFSGM